MKFYRINARTKQIESQTLKDEYKKFGSRGLIAKVLTDEVDPQCDPMGGENKLVLATTLLAGTTVPTAHRMSFGGKSPLTGTIKEANVGGTIGTYMARHGIKLIVIEDLPEDESWQLLLIDEYGVAKLVNADDYAGLNTYDLTEKVRESFGEKISLASIGVAGERFYKSASIQVTDFTTGHPVRAAGRGGLGALMASKRIKAIVIEKPKTPVKIDFEDREKYNEAAKAVIKAMQENPVTGQVFPTYGTSIILDGACQTGQLPVKNFTGEEYQDSDKISGQAFLETVTSQGGKTGVPCQAGCIVRCSNVYHNRQGEYVTSGLEYETIALSGPNWDVKDWDILAEFDKLCDDFGIDTIDAGAAIGVCMEAGKISWGDGEAALELIRDMIKGSEFGDILGNGAYETGMALGVKRIPAVKKQALAAYDPRNNKRLGMLYATNPMGADHTSPANPDPSLTDVEATTLSHILGALTDNLMCLFAITPFKDTIEGRTMIAQVLEGIYGGKWDDESLLNIGRETMELEYDFNRRAGFTADDDRLPEFFQKEKSPMTDQIFDISNEDLDESINSL